MPSVNIEIINKLGLHARAASKLVSVTSKFSSDISITKGDKIVDAKSIMSVMMLAATKGTNLQIETKGEDQNQAMEAITFLINNKFDEEE
jgi:phosphocarrier protein